MIRRTLFAIALCACPLVAMADWQTPDPWTQDQKVLAGTFLAAGTVDWLQTRNIARDPFRRELNPLLGPRPTVAEVNRHFLLSGIAFGLAAHYLPSGWRTKFLAGAAFTEVAIVLRNDHLGVSARF